MNVKNAPEKSGAFLILQSVKKWVNVSAVKKIIKKKKLGVGAPSLSDLCAEDGRQHPQVL